MSSGHDEKQLPFVEHLRELRTRVVRSLVYFTIAIFVAWNYHSQIFAWLTEPYLQAVGDQTGSLLGNNLGFRGPVEPVVVYFKVSMVAGAIVSLPLVLLELWLFVAPGLYKSERRMAAPFLFSTLIFFLGGVAFCRYLVLTTTMKFLLGMAEEGTIPAIMMEEYYAFSTNMLFIFGALFELPVIIAFLSFLGIVTHRGLWNHWRYAVLASFVVGGILTPPDPISQIMLAGPLVVLYFLSIGIAWMITKRRERNDARPALEPT